MHATKVLQKILSPVIARLDARNVRNLFSAVEALLVGRRLTLMELARHFPGAERIAAPLKRLDRLLGNPRAQALRTELYRAALAWLIRSPRPVLVVDWSELKSDGRWHLLRAAVVVRGRTITVYEEVHPEARKHHPMVHTAFLARFATLLPPGVRPILVTDAGFRVPWFQAVESLGWAWVGRVRDRARLRSLEGNQTLPRGWFACKQLYTRASARAVCLGHCALTERNDFPCRLVLMRRRKRGRVAFTRHGQRARNGYSLKNAQRAKDPWLLASSCSLATLPATEIVRLYASRMQIEQSFRDLKSHRYGCAFEDTLTREGKRLEMLLLIHALATLIAWLEGLATTTLILTAPLARVSTRCRHSAVWLGWERLRRTNARLSLPLPAAAQRLREMLAQVA